MSNVIKIHQLLTAQKNQLLDSDLISQANEIINLTMAQIQGMSEDVCNWHKELNFKRIKALCDIQNERLMAEAENA